MKLDFKVFVYVLVENGINIDRLNKFDLNKIF